MCNNNGACRKLAGGVMCPSYRVTRDERDVTRGRANTLRLAITGQLGPDALASDEMAETLKLCVSCKACRRECPTGVDMARMKIEVQAARADKHGLSLHDRLVGFLPRYAPYAARLPLAVQYARSQRADARSRRSYSPAFRRAAACRDGASDIYRDRADWRYGSRKPRAREVVLFADTFNRYFERENLDAAISVLAAGGYRVHAALPKDGDARPLCCGRTFLSVGLVDEARRGNAAHARCAGALRRARRAGGRAGAELPLDLPRRDCRRCSRARRRDALAANALLFEEFLAREHREARLDLPLGRCRKTALLHGHCHQKAFDGHGRGRKRAPARSRNLRSRRSNRAAAAWPAPSATTPTPSMCRSRWASCRCCRRCARRRPTR